ncbi:hypothetical protein [Bifidobacterium castoris]|uniref:Uncharacterized protein n=1 Tax=Bifidobacterium castoris TaxID=2306972 RepID=A0A430FAN0_9BIFI|nr:hypothetical protein [Bifidobacterium castoris]RSX49868.1 hypothetical protein D2E22_0329 [Bifidobacterium castoris]
MNGRAQEPQGVFKETGILTIGMDGENWPLAETVRVEMEDGTSRYHGYVSDDTMGRLADEDARGRVMMLAQCISVNIMEKIMRLYREGVIDNEEARRILGALSFPYQKALFDLETEL